MTFTILIILTLAIKAMSIAVSKYVASRERRKPKEAIEAVTPTVPETIAVKPPSPTVPVEAIAAAITGVQLYLEEKTRLRKPTPPKHVYVNYWVLSWRLDSTMNLNELDYTRWGKSRRIRW